MKQTRAFIVDIDVVPNIGYSEWQQLTEEEAANICREKGEVLTLHQYERRNNMDNLFPNFLIFIETNVCKVREDIADTVSTDDGILIDGNTEYEYKWTGKDEDEFKIFINGEWRTAESVDFEFKK